MPEQSIKVLQIEHDPASAGAAAAALAADGPPGFVVESCGSLAVGLPRFTAWKPDVLLLDLDLPGSAPLEVLARVRHAAPETPIVVMTDGGDAALWASALREGADDHLEKGGLTPRILPRVLRCALERKRAEVREEHLKDEFLHNVSHELKTPLTAIHQSVRLVMDGLAGPASPTQKKFLDIADRNIAHLRAMIEDLLDVTRAETGKLTVEPRRMALEEVVDDVIATERMNAQSRGIELSASIPRNVPYVQADPVRVRQILINLIDNALGHTPKGGSTCVRARVVSPAGMVEVAVADTGVGMEPEAARRVFDRLYQVPGARETTGRRGLGLGLYICKQLVERHGGSIRVESQPGKGTVFFFTLPVFSLTRLLEPLIVRDGRPAPNFALLCAELWPAKQSFSEQSAHGVLLEARNVLRQSAHPEDVLLPEMSPPGKEGLVFIAACLHPKSVQNMARRLEAVLGGAYYIKSHRLAPRISHQIIPLGGGHPHVADEAAGKVSELVLRAVEGRGAGS